MQGNIYFILSDIVKDYNVNKVYDEGLTESFAPIKNLCAKVNYISNNPTKKENSIIDKLLPSKIDSLDKLKEKSPNIYDKYLLFQKNIEYDAVYKLASKTDNLEIIGADDANALDEAIYMYDRLSSMGFFRWFTERGVLMLFEKTERIFF